MKTIGDPQHGSNFKRFLRGEWTACKCGYDPKDNQKLNTHFAEHGFREVDDHGHIVRHPVKT